MHLSSRKTERARAAQPLLPLTDIVFLLLVFLASFKPGFRVEWTRSL